MKLQTKQSGTALANGGAPAPVTQVLALRCLRSGAGACCDFHSHTFPEFTLVTDDSTINGWALGKIGSAPNTLYLFLPGEPHGHWNSSTQRPRFWVIHFSASLLASLPHLADPDPARRVWKLTDEQAKTFRWLFIKLFNEHTHPLAFNQLAELSWLQLLLVSVERWVAGTDYQELLPEQPDNDVLQLWHMVNECVGRSSSFVKQISRMANYDSVRHRFKSLFRLSPTQLLVCLRMQKAQHLLLDTALSIKEISACLGYDRQHEFARAFRKQIGQSPSAWRHNPLPGEVSPDPRRHDHFPITLKPKEN
jgi:AraC-like DNA-binding protein